MQSPLYLTVGAVMALVSVHSSAATLLSSGTSTAVSSVNLSTAGTSNWAVWDNRSNDDVASDPIFSQKASGATGTISAVTTTNTTGTTTVRGPSNVSNYPANVFSWTGGTASVPTDGIIAGVFHSTLEQTANGVKFSITDLPALTGGQSYLVNVYFTAYAGSGGVTATTGALSQTQTGAIKANAGVAKSTDIASFNYNPDSVADTLGIAVKLASGSSSNRHALLQAVAISVVPEPSAALLSLLGVMLLVGKRRR